MTAGDLSYTVVLLREEDGGYSAHVPALKGCHTQGDDIAEALLMAEDAIRTYVAVLMEDGEPIPPDVNTVVFDWAGKKEALVYRVKAREPAPVA